MIWGDLEDYEEIKLRRELRFTGFKKRLLKK